MATTKPDVNVVEGVFGLTPEMYLQQRQAQDVAAQNQAAEEYGKGGFAPQYARNVQTGQLLQQGLGGIFGVEDPQLQMIRDVSQMRQNYDITTAQGMQDFAKAIAPKYPQLAVQAVDKANIMMKEGAVAQTAQQKIDQEKLLREELAKLGDNPSDESMLKVFRKFGTPDQQAKALQMSIDKKIAMAQAAATKANKPLPPGLQKDEQKDLEAIDNYQSQSSSLTPAIQALTADEKGVRLLELGPLKNAKYMAQNASGNSTPESRAYEGLQSAVKTAVNLQVEAQKGVQTDKDVLRFADALISAYGKNDTQATLLALKRYQDAINAATLNTANRLESRRKSQNVESYYQGQVPQANAAPAAKKTVKFSDL